MFYAAIRRDSISLLKFPFLSHVQVLLFIPCGFFTSVFVDGLLLESNYKSHQVFMTLFGILTDLNNTLVWIVAILPMIFCCPRFFFQAFVDRSMNMDDDWHHHHLHSPVFVKFLYFTSSECFTPAWTDELSLESEWRQVSSSLQNFSLYFKRS